MYQGWFAGEWWAAWDAYSKGNATAGNQFMRDAQYSLDLAASRGCTWAQARVALPTPIGVLPPVIGPSPTTPPVQVVGGIATTLPPTGH